MNTHGWYALLILSVVLALAACGSSDGAEEVSSATPGAATTAVPESLTSEAVKRDYEAARASFGAAFPDDVELPSLSDRIDRLVAKADGPVSFEEGYGESELVIIWRCAWERSYLNAAEADDAKAKARAATELSTNYYEIPAVKRRVSDPGRAFDREVIQPALNGDLGPLNADLKNSCGKPFVP